MFAKSTWYYWFINYIPELIRKWLVVLKTNLLVFLKQTQPKCVINVYAGGKKPRKPKRKKQSKGNVIMRLKKEN